MNLVVTESFCRRGGRGHVQIVARVIKFSLAAPAALARSEKQAERIASPSKRPLGVGAFCC